ncbi:CaiB/BaiF CoA transferase family protein [Paraburkholderia atlantica]|uniref:Crotonobetainyl-CoA:carnitine CoA-transferase CaiB-like acyl-CoA transferase n=1 Tax=Paraburkholderia atlantica TaxID=2654982 RepID=A0A7W8V5E6_PARAM|nr:CaiB/BaiF CoA-transferase family protein [Paraburkholderia atlantica]MBB5414693.1 crotonobetainyl-CoA:carnitine CoA-transferase CaiB-like acyl-CoA transferase [Paraburkholderia atlantica]MBB5423505.1 crotonobetainyl-CoA:carnitine CoA-transferase CaiB-like acyl-CoA transferase [Paraburkholderia atlantica]
MGPLAGVRIVELAGIGPGPMAAMLLADLGATVLRIERRQPVKLGIERPLRYNLLLRNRKTIALDLKDPEAVELVLSLVERADALIEGFRPGVTERLGLGPQVCLERNPKLAYGRITGWGQEGPLAQYAGHDLNYIAITGVLNAIGRCDQPPSIPLNLIGDYAGGSLYLAMGLLSAILHARNGGAGQVVDAAIVDGTANLATTFFGMQAAGIWRDGRGTNITDSGSHFYDVYECADGKWITVGPIEDKFYVELLRLLDIDPQTLGTQLDASNWPAARALFALKFKSRTREQWSSLLEHTDACFAPVLSWTEAPAHAHLKARGTFIEVDGIVQPAPAPRFSATVPAKPTAPEAPDASTVDAALAAWLDPGRIGELKEAGTLA